MFKFTMYSESNVHDRRLDIYRRIGEDAHPVVTDLGMFAADGMGGNAGIKILNVFDGNNYLDSDCFNEECAGKLVISALGKMPDKRKEKLLEYFLESYSSLFTPEMRKVYEQFHHDKDGDRNVVLLKKSGFFGSHALGMVMHNYLLSLEENVKDAAEEENVIIVRQPEGAEPEPPEGAEKTDENSSSLVINAGQSAGNSNTEKPGRDLEAEAKKLVDELLAKQFVAVVNALKPNYTTNLKNMTPFGTTLISALYEEHPNAENSEESTVDVVYISAGDSRCYALNRSMGFFQAVDDQTNGSHITSMVELARAERTLKGTGTDTEPALDISISKVYSYQTPCILFCMTDGFYDAFNHFLPLSMEVMLLSWIANSSSADELRSNMKNWFDPQSTVDDSHSLGMVCFGLDTYDEVREFAKELLDNSVREYCLNELPKDFLRVDYEERRKKATIDLITQNADLLHSLIIEEEIKEYCKSQVALPPYQKYLKDVNAKKKEYDVQEEKLKSLREKAAALVRKDYLEYAQWYCSLHPGKTLSNPHGKVKLAIDTRDKIKKLRNDFRTIYSSIEDLLKAPATTAEGLTGGEDVDEVIEAGYDAMDQLVRISGKFIREKFSSPLSTAASLNVNIRNNITFFNQLNSELAAMPHEKYAMPGIYEIVDFCFEKWDKDSPFTKETVSYADEMNVLCKYYLEQHELLEQLEGDINTLNDEALEKYWKDNAVTVFYEKQTASLFSAGACGIARSKLRSIIENNAEIKTYEEYAEKQKRMRKKYLDKFTISLGEERRKIVMEKGWQC